MPNPASSTFLIALLSLSIAACGGKIVEEPNATRGGSGLPDPAFLSPSPSPKPAVEDACGAICERDGKCGAFQTDCREHCENEIQSASSCTAQAKAYIHCYADNLDFSCTALPPVCESAYCAYTRCAGKVVPTYCH